MSSIFFDSFKVLHHSRVTGKIHGYPHNFCNRKVMEMGSNRGQYFLCIFHNGFKFDMTILTKGLWLSLQQTKDVSLLRSALTNLKSYTIGNNIKFIDSVKYYQQPFSRLASSVNAEEKSRVKSLFLEHLTHVHPYYSNFFMSLSNKDREFVLEYLVSGKGCFPYE